MFTQCAFAFDFTYTFYIFSAFNLLKKRQIVMVGYSSYANGMMLSARNFIKFSFMCVISYYLFKILTFVKIYILDSTFSDMKVLCC